MPIPSDRRYVTSDATGGLGTFFKAAWDSLAGKPAVIAAGADAAEARGAIDAAADIHSHTSANITDFTEAAQDAIAEGLLQRARYFANVADLKAASLPDGTAAVTLGYYTAGDGGGSTYRIATSAAEDDGGGVLQLANAGVRAVLVPGQSVSYRQFGAKLDGNESAVAAETLAIQRAHVYANANRLPVVQRGGIILLNATVNVQTSTDLTGCVIRVRAFSGGKTPYLVASSQTPVSVIGVNQAELTRGAAVIPSLAAYKHHFVKIISDEILCRRHDGGSFNDEVKKDSFVLTRDGALINGGLLQDFTAGNLTITAYPPEAAELVFQGPRIEWDIQDPSLTCTVVSVRRSNTTFKNVTLAVTNTVDYNDSAATPGFKGRALHVANAHRVTLSNIQAENITEGVNLSGYIVQMEHVSDVTFQRVTMLNGWGATGTYYVRDWVVTDSQINRLDCHVGLGDLYCRNVRFVGGWGVFTGYGDGTINLVDCTHEFVNIDGREYDSCVFIALTYGLPYRGRIKMTRPRVVSRSARARYLVQVKFSGANDYRQAYDLKLPSLTVREASFQAFGSEALHGYYTDGIDNMATSLQANSRKLALPQHIDIHGVTFDQDGTVFTPLMLPTGGTIAPYLESPPATLRRATGVQGGESGISAAAAYTLQPFDAGRRIFLTNAGATTVTVPAGVFNADQRIDIIGTGGAVTFAAGSGLALTGAPSLTGRTSNPTGFSVVFRSATEAVVIGGLA